MWKLSQNHWIFSWFYVENYPKKRYLQNSTLKRSRENINQSCVLTIKFSCQLLCSGYLQWRACDVASSSSLATGAPSDGCWWCNPPGRTPACRSAASPTTADPRSRPSQDSRSSGSFRDRRGTVWVERGGKKKASADEWNPPGLQCNDRLRTFAPTWACRLRVPRCGSRRVRRRSSAICAPTWRTSPARSRSGGTRPRASPQSLRSEKDKGECHYSH